MRSRRRLGRDGSPLPVSLLQVPVGIVSVVVGTPRDKAASLLALGIYPGVTVELRQKYPCPIVKCDETEVAFDEAIARGIMVRPA